LVAARLPAKSIVAKKSLSIAPSRQLIYNGELEAVGTDGFAGWRRWALGFFSQVAAFPRPARIARCAP
jgi:hypothetical protein